MANGNATTHGSLRRIACTNTNPKLTTVIGYRIVQIRRMLAGEGAQEGFARELYQAIQGIVSVALL